MNQINSSTIPLTHHPENQFQSPGYSSQISAYDLWCSFQRNQKLFWVIVLTIMTIGFTLVVLSPPAYEFTQVMKVANYAGNNSIEIIDTVTKKIQEMVIPELMTEKIADPKSVKALSTIEIKKLGEKNPNYLVFKIDGPLAKKAFYEQIFNMVLQRLDYHEEPYIQLLTQQLHSSLINSEDTFTGYQALMDQKNRYLISMNNLLAAQNKKNSNATLQNSSTETLLSTLLNQQGINIALLGEKTLLDSKTAARQLTFDLNTIKQADFIDPMNLKRIAGDRPIKILSFFIIALAMGFIAIALKEFFTGIKKRNIFDFKH